MMKISKFLTLLSLVVWVTPTVAEITSEFEPDYAEATLAYHAKDYNKTLKILNELQRKMPKESKAVEVLELKAITLKASKKDLEASKIYQELIQILNKSGKEKKEIAPYAFELGVMNFNEKKFDSAEQYLSYSYRNEFNIEVSLFYLGLIAIQKKNWSAAEARMEMVAQMDLLDVQPAAHYYLAQAYFKNSSPSRGLGELVKAKNLATEFETREDVSSDGKKMAAQIKNVAEQALAPFNRSAFFANMALTTGYDSNVLLVPSETAGSQDVAGKSTLKTALNAGVGYATSPLDPIQWVPSLRVTVNKNYNSDSFAGEFSDTTLAVYATKNALSNFAYGAKAEGAMVFQNDKDPVTRSSTYRLYSGYYQVAPYLKWDFHRKWSLGGELGVKRTSYNGEKAVLKDLRRGGNLFSLKVNGLNKRGKAYFNPNYAFKLEINDTTGTEFQSNAWGAQVLNVMHLKHFDLTQILDFSRTLFPDSSTDRKDTQWVLSIIATRKIGPRWGLIGSTDYTINSSTQKAVYQYNRFTLNAGLSYNF